MARYVTSGLTVVTAATANHAVAELWNPHTTRRLYLREVHVFTTAATLCYPLLRRSSAKGTAGSTVTPGIGNDYDGTTAPSSAVTLELAAFTGQPTLVTGDMQTGVLPASIGVGYMWVFSDIPEVIPAVSGMCIVTATAIAFPVSRVTFVHDE